MSSSLAIDPSLVRVSLPNTRGWSGLHEAAKRGHAEIVRLLLDHGADPNLRETGDNTCPLHWAAAHRHIEIVRALVDPGGDVHGVGDDHALDVIGWATLFRDPGRPAGDKPEVAALLMERGARHHIFSAIAVGDPNLVRSVVEQNPGALDRRMSRFEEGLTPLHLAISLKRYGIVDLLIELGADLETEDGRGRTPLAAAMMQRDWEAVRRLSAAGAKDKKGWTLADAKPDRNAASKFRTSMAKQARSVKKIVPMIRVPDIDETLDWYVSIGFKELGRYGEGGVANFGMVSFGGAEIMLMPGAEPAADSVRLWFSTMLSKACTRSQRAGRSKWRKLACAGRAAVGTASTLSRTSTLRRTMGVSSAFAISMDTN